MTTKVWSRTRVRPVVWGAMFGCLLLAAQHVAADDIAAQARGVVDKWKDTVVTVRLVIKTTTSFGGAQADVDEQKSDATATVIDPSGLAVVSLSETDPARMFEQLMREYGSDDMQFNMDSKVTDIKLRFADGKEVPAKVVLRDKDLDLAFVRPEEKPAQPLAAVDLSAAAVPELVDQIVLLDRLGAIGDWAISASIDRVLAILDKPRKMYVPGASGFLGGMGAPVFALDGKIIGVTLMRAAPSGQGFSFTSGMDDLGMLPVILPAADILEVAKQAEE